MSDERQQTVAEPSVLTDRRGHLGLLTLNRPRSINALTHEMVSHIVHALDAWRNDEEIRTVAIVGAGERGLCAGGDIVALYQEATQGDGAGAAAFWADEYEMNALIAAYPKPVVAVQDGLVLGGGIGVSGHASHRLVTERSKLGFPEVAIGFVPDVGASWLLSRSPGQLGVRIALTAESVGAADAILLGLADTFVQSTDLPALLTALQTAPADTVIERFAADLGPAALQASQAWVDQAFRHSTVGEILAALTRLSDSGNAEAGKLADTISAQSPLALTVTLELLRQATQFADLETALEVEYRVSTHALKQPDFAEGVRAQVIDKDRNPSWSPIALADVTDQQVSAFFQNTSHGDLNLRQRLAAREQQ